MQTYRVNLVLNGTETAEAITRDKAQLKRLFKATEGVKFRLHVVLREDAALWLQDGHAAWIKCSGRERGRKRA